MSIIVMGMEMPIGCDGCKLRYRHQGAYVTDHCFYNMKIVDPWTFGRSRNGDKPDWCPLRPLPEKHGRLIDANALVGRFEPKQAYFTEEIINKLGTAPVIVEAEGE